jgi:hypothetical protein
MSYIGHGVAGLDGLRDFTTAKLQSTSMAVNSHFILLSNWEWLLHLNSEVNKKCCALCNLMQS